MKNMIIGILIALMVISFANSAFATDTVISSITLDQGDADGNGGNFNDGTIFRMSITDLVSKTPFCYGAIGTINSAGDVADYRRLDAFTCMTASVNNVNYKATAGYADLAGGILYGLLSASKNITPGFSVNTGVQAHHAIDNKFSYLGGQRFSVGGSVSENIKDINTSFTADVTEDNGTYGGDDGRRAHLGIKAVSGRVGWFYSIDAPLTNSERPTQYSGSIQYNF